MNEWKCWSFHICASLLSRVYTHLLMTTAHDDCVYLVQNIQCSCSVLYICYSVDWSYGWDFCILNNKLLIVNPNSELFQFHNSFWASKYMDNKTRFFPFIIYIPFLFIVYHTMNHIVYGIAWQFYNFHKYKSGKSYTEFLSNQVKKRILLGKIF